MTRTIITCPEQWLPVMGHDEYYEVSNLGNVRSVRRNIIIKSHPDKNGYLQVRLFVNNVKYKYFIHRLVALAFIPNEQYKSQVNHKDGDKQNNHEYNLEWVTPKQNIHHAEMTGLRNSKGSKNIFSTLNEDQVFQIKRMLADKLRQTEIAILYGVQKACISKIKLNRTWRHVQ